MPAATGVSLGEIRAGRRLTDYGSRRSKELREDVPCRGDLPPALSIGLID